MLFLAHGVLFDLLKSASAIAFGSLQLEGSLAHHLLGRDFAIVRGELGIIIALIELQRSFSLANRIIGKSSSRVLEFTLSKSGSQNVSAFFSSGLSEEVLGHAPAMLGIGTSSASSVSLVSRQLSLRVLDAASGKSSSIFSSALLFTSLV